MFSRPLRKRRINDLTPEEIMALAISSEEEDCRRYLDYARALRQLSPESATTLEQMAAIEIEHRQRLVVRFRECHGEQIPLVRRDDIAGFSPILPLWVLVSRGPKAIRDQVTAQEAQSRAFYERASMLSTDLTTRSLLQDLAAEEAGHEKVFSHLATGQGRQQHHASEDEQHRRRILLQYVQPALAGLMDGSVSTLAPLFAAAFATQNSWSAFLVGIAASVGAGISMGFAEALSDDGTLTGRGSPITRGVVTGAMTTIGGVGHTLPYLINDFLIATVVAVAVVVVELIVIAWIRWKYMDTPFLSAAFQIVFGGALVFAAGILIGNA